MSEEKITKSSQAPEELINSLQSGELSSLMDRVKEAQEKIEKMRHAGTTNDSMKQKLSPSEIAEINSLIIHDILTIRNNEISPNVLTMADKVLKAAIIQHGRMLDVDFTKD